MKNESLELLDKMILESSRLDDGDEILKYDKFDYFESLKNENYTFDFNDFSKMYSKLYHKDSSFCRYDLIIDLFNSYLFDDDLDDLKISGNMMINDYVSIGKDYFEFLFDNFFDKLIVKSSTEEVEEAIKKVYETNYIVEDDFQLDVFEDKFIDEVELREVLIRYFNPFNPKYIKLLLRLYKIVNIHDYDEQIVELLEIYNMKEEMFDFIGSSPNSLSGWAINNVYDIKSANIVFYILNDRINKIELEKDNIDKYYFKLLDILKDSNNSDLLETYYKFKYLDIKNIDSIFDKIDLFNQLEDETFKKYRIGFEFCMDYYGEIFFAYRVLKNKEETKEDLFDFDFTESNICELTDDLESKLRLLYFEIKNHFLNFDFNVGSIKHFCEDFKNISNIEKMVEDVSSKKEIFELDEISRKYNEIEISVDYNQVEAEMLLLDEFRNINVDCFKYVNVINYYSKVKKLILSAVHLWNFYTKTHNMNIDKDGQEYTPLVANYFKTIEVLLYRRIRDKYQRLVSMGLSLKTPYSVSGKIIDLTDNSDNDISLGEMIKYLKRETNILNNDLSSEHDYFLKQLEDWKEDVRNSHFHKDLILSKKQVIGYKNRTLKLIVDIIDFID